MLRAGDNRRFAGEDLMQGKPALAQGTRLGPAACGLLASLGLARVPVFRRLRDAGAFNSADFFALQEGAATLLAADLVGMDQLAVAPGGSASKTLTFEPEATTLGVMASLRDPAGKVWRAAVPVTPGSTVTATATLGPAGLALTMA